MKVIFTTGEENNENFIRSKKKKVWCTPGTWHKGKYLYHFRKEIKKILPDTRIKFGNISKKQDSDCRIILTFKNYADEAVFIAVQDSITIDFRKDV